MRTIDACRSCWSENLTEFLDLGEHHLSDFRLENTPTPTCPLVAVICDDCMLVQLKHTAESSDMYHENYGFKSGVSDSIKNDLKDIVSTALEYYDGPKSWLDIASNDGTLLSFVPNGIYRTGVDPISKYCEMAAEHADEIINDFFDAKDISGSFDIITSISCFYDMDNPNKFVADVKDVMSEDGIWVIQQNYLLPTLQLNAVDNFCAEHLEYYTLMSLEVLLNRHGLQVIDLSTSMVNGGSLRTIVAKTGVYMPSENVERQRNIEFDFELDTMNPYERFASEVHSNLKDLKKLVDEVNKDGQTVAILAASTRGSTIWQACGFGPDDIAYAVERNPEKVGKYFNAIGIPIISEEEAHLDNPDYMIVGPWFFAFPEIIERERDYVNGGGSLVVPLPRLVIINEGNIDGYTTAP